jgi:hypothetical protein
VRTTLFLSIATLFLVVGTFSVLAGDAQSHWFDLEGCSMCKALTEDPELLPNMSWEQFDLQNGIISVTTVKPEHMASFKKANEKQMMVGEKLMKGEMLPMCNSCQAMGMIMMKGQSDLQQEMINTKYGSIWILTSPDKKIVAELQQWAHKNQEELKKWEEMEKKNMKQKKG